MEEMVLNTAALADYVMSHIHSPTVRVWEADGTITLRENGGQQAKVRRVGFLKGQIVVPADFDTMGQKTINGLFEGSV
jgi:hypothetical protein